ncbi:MAG: hypothetical protein ACYS3S_22835, partial [Planctomycetota bacterium]
MAKSSNTQNHDKLLTQVKELMLLRLSQMHSYHDHKETMAHAGLLVGLVLLGSVLGASSWPPSWVPDIQIPARFVAMFGVCLLWLLIHIYVRWQLRNRRVAALYTDSLLMLLRKWTYKKPSQDQLKQYQNEDDLKSFNTIFPERSRLFDFIDKFVFPVKSAFLPSEEGMKDYPAEFVAIMIKTRNGATAHEFWLSLGSITMLV